MADFGYDIADYTNVDPMFGTLAEFDALVEDAHRLGIKLILDLAPNHISARPLWVLASRASRGDPRRHWYVWRDAAGYVAAPKNWLPEFGGRARELGSRTSQYYGDASLGAEAG